MEDLMLTRKNVLLMMGSLPFGIAATTGIVSCGKPEEILDKISAVASPLATLNQSGIFKSDGFKAFDGDRAHELALLVQESYAQFEQQSAKTWSIPNEYQLIQELSQDSKSQLFGFVAQKDKDLYIIIRGTRTIYEWFNNTVISYTKHISLNDKQWGETTKGFSSIYLELRKYIKNGVKQSNGTFNRVFVSGHSLGGALATLAIPDLIDLGIPASAITVYTFASPRAGDRDFSQKINKTGIQHWRIANTEDIVPALPGATANIISPNASPDNFIVKLYRDLKRKGMKTFEHTGTPIYFTVGTNSIEENHGLSTTYMQGIGQPNLS